MKRYYNATTKEWHTEGQSMTRKDGNTLFSGVPTEEQLKEWGFEEYVAPEPEPHEPTEEELEQMYVYRVRSLIKEKYAIEDELAIQRKMMNVMMTPSMESLTPEQTETILEEYAEYNAFVEECKAKAKDTDI